VFGTKFVRLDGFSVVVRRRRAGELEIAYTNILTAERRRSRRSLDLHTRQRLEPASSGAAVGWRAYRVNVEEGDEPAVAFYCPACAEREFGPPRRLGSPS
jgi:hypothetical protein